MTDEKVIDIHDLVQDKHNFNRGTTEGQALMERSFSELGAGRSILLDKDNQIIAGNKSQKAAQAAGIKRVRVIETDGTELIAVKRTDVELDSAEGRRMALLDNLTTQVNLSWDKAELQGVGDMLPDFDVADYGISIDTLPDGFVSSGEQQGEGAQPAENNGGGDPNLEEDDFDPDAHYETKVKEGEVWQLGNHRLMCGDSTNPVCVEKLLNGNRADMVFTDPPYGIDYSGGRTQVVGKKDYGKLKNDDLQGNELGHLICNVFNYNKDNADVYICVSPIMQKPFLDYIEKAGKTINAVIVWDKKAPGLGYMAYRRQCEFILFVKGGDFHKGDKSDVDMWRIGRDDATTYVHGTQKPIGVAGRAINNSSNEGDSVLDYFGGSGSTLIACEQLGRKCYMMELDPHYCSVIIARWEKFTGQKAVKIENV